MTYYRTIARIGDMSDDDFSLAQARMQELAIELKRLAGVDDIFDELMYAEGLAFTPGGMLVVSVLTVEALRDLDRRRDISSEAVDEEETTQLYTQTLRSIIRETRDHPALPDKEISMEDWKGTVYPMRSSLSIIKAIRNLWCTVFPFCSPE